MSEITELKYAFSIKGMTCASCVRNVERAINKTPGVKFVSVNLATEKAVVIAESDVTLSKLEDVIKDAGYELTTEKQTEDVLEARYKETRKNLFISLSITIPLVIIMLLNMNGFKIEYFEFIELIASLAVLIFSGRKILKGTWIALSHFHTNMDTLITLGVFASIITNILNVLKFPIISFGSGAAMLITIFLAGRYIESRLKDKTAKSIKSLLQFQPDTATILVNNDYIDVPIETIKPGQVLIIKTGDRIPLDSLILEGDGYIDESMISGEPIPVHKSVDSKIIGGTILISGNLKAKVEKVGEDTFLSQMIKLIEEAQSSKVPIQAFADRITLYFIPIVFTLALLSSLIWFFNYESLNMFFHPITKALPWTVDMGHSVSGNSDAFSKAVFIFIATIVIACPCALGLATPMALVAGSGAAAKKGLIIRNGETIQTSKDLKILLMDKTGTLTEGKPKVVKTNLDDETIKIISSLEKNSNHPLAKAIYENFPVNSLSFTNISETPGIGISGDFKEDNYFIGKPKDSSLYKEEMQKGHTVVEISKNGVISGFISISDPLKPDSAEAVKKLKKMGIKPVMLTGDNEITAKAVAELAGIEEYIAGVSPSEKVDVVDKYRMMKKVTGMVGDGINDAAALKSADIGFAIGTGTDLAIENGDIIIVKGELSKIIDAVEISRNTFKKIKQNLFWAFFYNVIAIPLAMTGLLHPVIAEIAMSFSSINVILNSARINK